MNRQSIQCFCGSFNLPHRVNLTPKLQLLHCNYTVITPEVVIISIIDALLRASWNYSAPTPVTGAEASSRGNVSTVTPHMMVQFNTNTLSTPADATQQKGEVYPDDVMLQSPSKRVLTSCGFSAETVCFVRRKAFPRRKEGEKI